MGWSKPTVLDKNIISEMYRLDDSSPSGLVFNSNQYKGRNFNVLWGEEGKQAGKLHPSGYWKVSYKGKRFGAHRVICLLLGLLEDQMLDVDHIDQNKSNNKIDNLRVVTSAVNSRNKPMRKDNSTGKCGVRKSLQKSKVIWIAFWKKSDGVLQTKSFSESKHGNEAFSLACIERDKQITILNEEGLGYMIKDK